MTQALSRRTRDGNACPRCGTPTGLGQEYCLECGVRLPARSNVTATLRRAWQRRLPYPGDWVWPLLVGLLVAGLAGAVVIAVSSGSGRRTTLVATGPPVTGLGSVRATTSAATALGATTTPATAPAQPPAAPAPPPPPSPGALTRWPSRTAGSTVVLESVPKTSAGRLLAIAKAKAAAKAGLKDVGVLDSSQFASLHPGYYVVFAGVYTTYGSATSAVTKARSNGYKAAYARQITP